MINKSELKYLSEDHDILKNLDDLQNTAQIPHFKVQFIEDTVKLYTKIQSCHKPLGLIKENKLKIMSDEIKQLKSQIEQIQKSDQNKKSSKSMK